MSTHHPAPAAHSTPAASASAHHPKKEGKVGFFRDMVAEVFGNFGGLAIFHALTKKVGEAVVEGGVQEVQKKISDLLSVNRDDIDTLVNLDLLNHVDGHQAKLNLDHYWQLRQEMAHKPYPGPNCQDFRANTDDAGLPIGDCALGAKCTWRYKPGEEITLLKFLVKRYEDLKSDPHRLIEAFVELGWSKPRDFDLRMDRVKDDSAEQLGKRVFGPVNEGLCKLTDGDESPLGKLVDWSNNLPGVRRK